MNNFFSCDMDYRYTDDMDPPVIANSVSYCANYCEENIWHLAGQFPTSQSRVVFISNAERQVCLWQQKLSSCDIQPVIWDYHVVLFEHYHNQWRCWDLDTQLPCPVSALQYLKQTFPASMQYLVSFAPKFRIVPAADYRRHFASDRSHMHCNGRWLSAPPGWPCIGKGNNLQQYINMDNASQGQVLSFQELKNALQNNLL